MATLEVAVTIALLNGELEEEVYMKQPQGYILEGQEELVCKLNKSVYRWVVVISMTALHKELDHMGLVQSTSDLCVYIQRIKERYLSHWCLG